MLEIVEGEGIGVRGCAQADAGLSKSRMHALGAGQRRLAGRENSGH